MKKKLLVIGPVTPQESDLKSIAATLSFLDETYTIDFIDSLSMMDEMPDSHFYQFWHQKLCHYLPQYEGFLGFSFGGVILQQCLSLFETYKKPLILFSTPTFADATLNKKLGRVISLSRENKVEEALQLLYTDVFYPNTQPLKLHTDLNNDAAAKRLIFGLTKVLQTDSRAQLALSTVDHLHLIGESSHLVNQKNVIHPENGRLLIVPGAGMRVLQDNLPYCEDRIREVLNSES